ncbi:pleckstrin like protein [Nannochloropsis oceanica]
MWHRRYFVLEGGEARLSWYTTQPHTLSSNSIKKKTKPKKPNDSLALEPICSVGIHEDDNGVFELWVPAKDRTYVLRAEPPEGRTEWIEALCAAMMSSTATTSTRQPSLALLPLVMGSEAEAIGDAKAGSETGGIAEDKEEEEEEEEEELRQEGGVVVTPDDFKLSLLTVLPDINGSPSSDERLSTPHVPEVASEVATTVTANLETTTTTVTTAPSERSLPTPPPHDATPLCPRPSSPTIITSSMPIAPRSSVAPSSSSSFPSSSSSSPCSPSPRSPAPLTVLEQRLVREKEGLLGQIAHINQEKEALLERVASAEEQLSSERLKLTKLGFVTKAEDIEKVRKIRKFEEELRHLRKEAQSMEETKSTILVKLQRMLGVEQATKEENVRKGRRINELEGEIRHFKTEAQASKEEKDAVAETLQQMQAEMQAMRDMLGCEGGQRAEEKMRERLEGWEVQEAEWLGEIKLLQQALIEQTERAEAQQREMEHAAATATIVAAGTADFASNATSAAVAETGEDDKGGLVLSPTSCSSSPPTSDTTIARDAVLEKEVRRLERALAAQTALFHQAQRDAAELREANYGIQNLRLVQQQKQKQPQQPQQQQQQQLKGEGLTALVGQIATLLSQLEQQSHISLEEVGGGVEGGKGGGETLFASFSFLSDCDNSSDGLFIQPEELVPHEDLSEWAHMDDEGEGAAAAAARTAAAEEYENRRQLIVQQLALRAMEIAETLTRKSTEFEMELERVRREKLFYEAKAMYAVQHCMRLREMTQAVSAKAAGFVAHAEVLLQATEIEDNSGSSRMRSNEGSKISKGSIGGVGMKQHELDEGRKMPVAGSDAEVLLALQATKGALEEALREQYEAHALLENELISEEVVGVIDSSSNSSNSNSRNRSRGLFENTATLTARTHPASAPIRVTEPLPTITSTSSDSTVPRHQQLGQQQQQEQQQEQEQEQEQEQQTQWQDHSPPTSLSPSLSRPNPHPYYPMPNHAILYEEESRLKAQRRKLREERRRMEALSTQLSHQKRSIDEQMIMLTEEVAYSRRCLAQRKAELRAAPETKTKRSSSSSNSSSNSSSSSSSSNTTGHIPTSERTQRVHSPHLSFSPSPSSSPTHVVVAVDAATAAAVSTPANPPPVPATSLSLLKRKARATKGVKTVDKLQEQERDMELLAIYKQQHQQQQKQQQLQQREKWRGDDWTETTAIKTQPESPPSFSSRLYAAATNVNNISVNSNSSSQFSTKSSSPSSRSLLKRGAKRKSSTVRSPELEKPLVGKTDMIRFANELNRLQQRLNEERSMVSGHASRTSP